MVSVSVTCSVTTPLEVVVDVENEVDVLVPIVFDSVDVIEVSVSLDVLLLDSCEREETSVLVVRMPVRMFVVVLEAVPVTVVVVEVVPVTETGFTVVVVVEDSEVEAVKELVTDVVVLLEVIESTTVVLTVEDTVVV